MNFHSWRAYGFIRPVDMQGRTLCFCKCIRSFKLRDVKVFTEVPIALVLLFTRIFNTSKDDHISIAPSLLLCQQIVPLLMTFGDTNGKSVGNQHEFPWIVP